MAEYEKIGFVDHVTPLNAENMGHLEDGIALAVETANEASNLTIGTVTSGETPSANIEDGKLNLVLEKPEKGEKGDPGPAGANGKDGAQGPAGADGAPGKNGATWYVVASAQSAGGAAPGGAVEGDFVLDSNGAVYKVNASTTLDDTGVNIKGAQGPAGANGADGNDGDPGPKGDPGETYTLPDATTLVRGGVLQAEAQADSVATDATGLVTDFNALLAKLRTAGILASS